MKGESTMGSGLDKGLGESESPPEHRRVARESLVFTDLPLFFVDAEQDLHGLRSRGKLGAIQWCNLTHTF
jgi:hypothetical protein